MTTAVVALALGTGAGYWLAQQGGREEIREIRTWIATKTGAIAKPLMDALGANATRAKAGVEAEAKGERRPLFYRHPMNPEVTSPVPAKDEMGMDYVPVYADAGPGGEPSGTVTIDPVTVQNIGVRTAPAEKRTLSHTIHTLGRIDYDEERLTRFHPKTEGWIEKLHVSRTGQRVERGMILLSIYSPQLVSSQQEYLLALKNFQALKDSPYTDIRKGAEELVSITRGRLELLDVPEHQLRELEETGKVKKSLQINSPFRGVVLAVGAREGQYVTPKTELYRIADLSRVWAYVDVYENELAWVQVGDEAEMQVKSLPGRTFRGKISYVYPYLERKTRTVKVRLEFENSDLALKPNMFVNVTLFPKRQVDAVVIPGEAVIRSGMREKVFVVRGPGKFEPREVKTGVVSGGLVQVIEGVSAGEEVVTSAQFLIDSESKLREATTKMLEPRQAPPLPKPAGPEDMEGIAPEGPSPKGSDMEAMPPDAPPARDMPAAE
jgi:Cu(I)/Ag(I) efflux system membrane fusion protein